MQGAQTNNQNSNDSSNAKPANLPASSNSPWEDDIDVPPAEVKAAPTIIGSLDPGSKVTNPKPFSVPENIDEKVGNKIPAENIINNPAQPVATINPAPVSETIPTTAANGAAAPIVPQPPVRPIAQPAPTPTPTIGKDIKPSSASTSVLPANQNVSSAPITPAEASDEFDWFNSSPAQVPNQNAVVSPAKPAENPTPQNPLPLGNINQTDLNIIPNIPIDKAAIKEKEKNSILKLFSKKKEESANPTAAPKVSSLPNVNFNGIGKKLLLIFGSIVLLFIIASGLTEYGILSVKAENIYGLTGIEQLWGGLSAEPEKAIVRSAAEMKSHPNFKARGTLELMIDKSMKSDITSPLKSSTGTVSNSNVVQIQDLNTSFLLKNNSQSSNVEFTIDDGQVDLQNTADKLYVLGNDKIHYGNNTDPTKWVSYEIQKLKDNVLHQSFFNIKETGGFSVRGNRVGNEKVGGERSYHYQISSLELGNTLAPIGITSDMIQSVSGDIWIGVRSKLITKINLKITPSISSSLTQINLSSEFYDYDISNTISDIDQNNIVSATSALTGDPKRKQDINNILAALKKYQGDNGNYPTTDNQLVKLDGTNKVLELVLVPSYLSSIPIDPNAENSWYYAYKSDGTTCSISARLESIGDPDGQLVNNVLLYLKYNSD